MNRIVLGFWGVAIFLSEELLLKWLAVAFVTKKRKLCTPKMEVRKESEKGARMRAENFLRKVRILIGAGRYTWKRSPLE